VLRIDHVVYATADLAATAETWRRDHGLDSVAGGRHERWGTENRIVPLGESYLELIAAFDRDLAATTAIGRSVLELADGGWLMPVLATDDIGSVASRLGLEVAPGERTRPDGEVVRWRSAGFDDPRRESWMPFFITWDVASDRHPGRARAGHGVRVTGIGSIQLGGSSERLEAWIGGRVPGLELTGGPDGIVAVTVATAVGELRIG
jgi:hypothetical protein